MRCKDLLLIVLVFTVFVQCTSAQEGAKKKGKQNKSGNNAQTDISSIIKNSDDPYNNGTKGNSYGVWGHGPLNNNTAGYLKELTFLRGWNITFAWRELEPQKGKFDWDYFDRQVKEVADNNLSVGFMVWVGHNSPEWLYNEGVQKVGTDNRKGVEYYPYYLNASYKDSYLNMLKAVASHIGSLPPSVKNKIIFWMSAEGTTGDITPYKGKPDDSKFDISDEKWFEYKKGAWLAMNEAAKKNCPNVNILINQGSGGEYFDWLVQNLPNAWMKVSGLTDDYSSAGEYTYYKRVQKAINHTMKDSATNRFRAECENVYYNPWFQQAPQWNTYALIGSCLHNGLDIFNMRPQAFISNTKDLYPLYFFNQYAGQKNPATAKGAFCILRDVLDVNDTKRFPESKYGKVLTLSPSDIDRMETRAKDLPDELQKSARMRIYAQNVSKDRVQAILKEFEKYGAREDDLESISSGNTTDFSNRTGRQKNQQMTGLKKAQAQGNMENFTPDKLNNDLGFDLIPDNYFQYLIQYAPNTTSRGYWRKGPKDQPFGRFARGFDHSNGMNEMLFALDNRFFSGSTAPQTVQVKVTYFDEGNGEWSLNYYDGAGKKKAYSIQCKGSGQWITKSVTISDFYCKQQLDHNCDLSLRYIAGDNTIFSTVEVLR